MKQAEQRAAAVEQQVERLLADIRTCNEDIAKLKVGIVAEHVQWLLQGEPAV